MRIRKRLCSGSEVNKNLRKQYVHCTMLLTHTSWTGLAFYNCKGKSTRTVEYYNRLPSIYASLWILQLVSPPDLRCFQQQNHRRLLKLFVLYLLTIDSDAALVSSTFEITHSSNFESRWLLPSDHLENSDFSPAAAHIVPAPNNDLPYQKYDTQTTQKFLLEEYSFMNLYRQTPKITNV